MLYAAEVDRSGRKRSWTNVRNLWLEVREMQFCQREVRIIGKEPSVRNLHKVHSGIRFLQDEDHGHNAQLSVRRFMTATVHGKMRVVTYRNLSIRLFIRCMIAAITHSDGARNSTAYKDE